MNTSTFAPRLGRRLKPPLTTAILTSDSPLGLSDFVGPAGAASLLKIRTMARDRATGASERRLACVHSHLTAGLHRTPLEVFSPACSPSPTSGEVRRQFVVQIGVPGQTDFRVLNTPLSPTAYLKSRCLCFTPFSRWRQFSSFVVRRRRVENRLPKS